MNELSKKYDVKHCTVSSIINNWTYVDNEYKWTNYEIAKNPRYKMDVDIAWKIWEDYKSDPRSFMSIARIYDCSSSTISWVIKNGSYKE